MITYHDIFTKYFPDSGLVVAQFGAAGAKVILETIPTHHHEKDPLTSQDFADIVRLNESGFSVYLIPNALKSIKKGLHTLDNFLYANAIYIDIDIEETKVCAFDEDFEKRERKMQELAGYIWMAPIPPSLTVQTRNGMQLYWFCSPDLETFRKLEAGLYEYFKEYGADHRTLREDLSETYDDGSLRFYDTAALLSAYPAQIVQAPKPILSTPPPKVCNANDIFVYVTSLPIEEQFLRINGTKLTGGETFTLTSANARGNIQIHSNGKGTPNWLDTKSNMMFSNNCQGMATVVQYAMYYGLTKKEIAQELKKIFWGGRECALNN
jgi:hypothetical protein